MKRILLTGTLLLALAACGGAGNNAAAGNAQGNAANVATPAANDAAAGDNHAESADGPRVLLTGTGLLADGTDASAIRFGAGRADTLAAVTRTLGQQRALNAIEDCSGSGPAQAADFGPLVLFFQQDRFVGWEQRDASEQPWIGTPGGASVGARRPDLAAALGGPIQVEQSTLGTEFSRDGISGLLASANADAQVDRLWAGSNCAMR
ncbi:MAG TPA: hypothetical protein VMG08_20440 [Allosphingosinicella sp.]|nr:hypothetical protein [Allosphingosinicella sp.]